MAVPACARYQPTVTAAFDTRLVESYAASATQLIMGAWWEWTIRPAAVGLTCHSAAVSQGVKSYVVLRGQGPNGCWRVSLKCPLRNDYVASIARRHKSESPSHLERSLAGRRRVIDCRLQTCSREMWNMIAVVRRVQRRVVSRETLARTCWRPTLHTVTP